MPRVSVIIPVYNVEHYLRQCLDSVLAQTLRDIEIILVDDGSTDSCPAIMREYAEKDSRIKIVTREHSNGGACRNAGLAVANGEYLSFLDSDDCFSPFLLEVLLRGATENHADIATCKYAEFVDGDDLPPLDNADNIEWIDQTLNGADRVRPNQVGDITWDKLYRHDLIREYGLRYVEQPSTNDVTFVWLAVSCARKIVATSRKYIAYRRHRGSTQGKKSRYPECGVWASRAYLKELERLKIFDKQPWLYKAYLKLSPQDMISYLGTMTTASAYRRAYREIYKLFDELDVLNACKSDSESYYERRARSIVKRGLMERMQSTVEGHLAPLLGTAATSGPIRREVIYSINRCLKLVFDFKPTICGFPRWLGRHVFARGKKG